MIKIPSFAALLAACIPLGAAAQPAERAAGHEFGVRFSSSGAAALDGPGPGAEVGVTTYQLSWRGRAALGAGTNALFGLEWSRHELDRTGATWLPENLKALTAQLGVAHPFAERWRLLVNAAPRIAGADGDLRDARADLAVLALATYDTSPDLSWSFGLRYGARSDQILLPIAGMVWRFAPEWEFRLAWPESGVSYRATESLTLRAIASILGGDYRLAHDPRPEAARSGPSWRGGWLEFREVRLGLAAEYAFARRFGLRLESGYVVDRRFEFLQRDLELSADGSLYGAIALTARF
ncbi:MAG TPA: DUF6268 family outer membrane beta-barrel protein [Opitutaceae bacterium]|nr:DUF6268 family outer membrane beta-barrel protein [Opitutaceae bacterium]